jgi:hypothetical protein
MVRRAFSDYVPLQNDDSSFYADVEGLYEDAIRLKALVERAIARRKPFSRREAESFLATLEADVVEHAGYHRRSLKNAIRRIVKRAEAIDSKRRSAPKRKRRKEN